MRLFILSILPLCVISHSALAKIKFLHSYNDHKDGFKRFADLTSQDYQQLAQQTFQRQGYTFYQYRYPKWADDIDLGHREPASSQIRHLLRTDSEIAYDAIYSLDQFSRRMSPIDHPGRRKHFIILAGCSFTFGQGLNDDQTLNYYLGKDLPSYYPYNYGIEGTGANSALALVEENRFHKEIRQKQGVFIYVSLGDTHVERTTGKLPSLTWLRNSPYYVVNGEEAARRGSFASGRPITTNFYLLIHKLLSVFHLSDRVFPPLTASDFHDQCIIVKKMRDEFLKQYPGSRFIYYRHPLTGQSEELSDCLKSHNVWLINGRLSSKLKEAELIKLDGHPTAKVNEEIAKQLTEVISGLYYTYQK